MATPVELRAAIAEARTALREAIGVAGANWERQPAGGEGEEAWSARQAAEHVIGTEHFFASAICEACGYDGPESPFGESGPTLLTPAEAQAALAQAIEATDAKIQHVTQGDLAHKHERMGSVAELMAFTAGHIRDHASQIVVAGA